MSDDLDRYLESHPEEVARATRFLDGQTDAGEDLGELFLDARLDAAERLEVEQPSAVWLVRLSGANVRNGWIDTDMQQRIVGALGKEVEAAAGQAADQARIGLVGVSSGSVILHFRPQVASLAATPDQLEFDVSAADAAIARVTTLHDMLERREPAAKIASAFKNDKDLLHRARVLVDGLNDFGIDLSTRWWTSDRARRTRSVLTERGRSYAAEIFEKTPKPSEEIVHGRVIALSLDGTVQIRPDGGRKNARAISFAASEDQVTSGEFVLGEIAHVVLQRIDEVDHVGVQGGETFEFLRHYSGPDTFLK